MTHPESQAEREAFEVAAEALGIPNNSVLAWKLWQARAALPPVAAASDMHPKQEAGYKSLVAALRRQLAEVQKEAAKNAEAVSTLASERAANAQLTDEIEAIRTPVAAASPSGQSHPYERDLAGLTEFIDAMCAGDSKSMALVQSAWYRCMARNHPANQAVPPAWTASQISSPAYQAEQAEKNRMMSALLEAVAEGRVGPAQVTTNNASENNNLAYKGGSQVAASAQPVPGMVLVSIADIHAIDRAMQHMGDVLNGMDAVEEGDDDLAAPGFEAMERLIAAAPNHGASAAAFTAS